MARLTDTRPERVQALVGGLFLLLSTTYVVGSLREMVAMRRRAS